MRGKIIGLIICLIVFTLNVHAQPAGPEFYEYLSLLPYIYPSVESVYLSSYDRTGGNDDGFAKHPRFRSIDRVDSRHNRLSERAQFFRVVGVWMGSIHRRAARCHTS